MHKKLKELRAKLSELKKSGRANLAQIKILETQIAALTATDEATVAKKTAAEASLAALVEATNQMVDDTQATEDAIADVERRLRREEAFSADRAPRHIESVDNGYERTFGFHNLADFALSVRRAAPGGAVVVDERLSGMTAALQAMQQNAAPTGYNQERGGSSDEGYMIPPEFRDQIWELVFDEPDIFNIIGPQPTARNSVQMFADETTPWGSSGVQAYWGGEAAQFTSSKLLTKSKMVALEKLYAFVLATDELLDDAPNLNDRLTRQSARAISWKLSDAVLYGTGAGQPTGWFGHASNISVAKESAQSGTFVIANAGKMMSRLLGGSLSRAIWLANSEVLPQLISFTVGNQPVWIPVNQGAQVSPYGGTLFGRPVLFTEHCKALASEGDVMLMDPQGYMAARKAAGVNFDTSIHLYFDYGVQAFRWTVRVGGQPYLSAAVSPANGSSTKGHFVTVAAR